MVSPETYPHGIKRRLREPRSHCFHRPTVVHRVARKIGTRQAVHEAAAASEMRYHAAPASVGGVAHQGFGIVTVRTPFQPVKVQQKGRRRILRFRCRPVKNHEVAVGHVDDFAAVMNLRAREKTRRNHRLQMRPRQPPGCGVVRFHDGHDVTLWLMFKTVDCSSARRGFRCLFPSQLRTNVSPGAP